MAQIAGSINDLIGNTPLIDLTAIADGKARGRIIGKYEATNPGGSIKDRIAKAIIDDGEKRGLINKGTTIIEATSGNTGVGLAMIAASRGYKIKIVMPESMSVERRKLIAAYGAELVLTPASEGIPGAAKKADELLAETPNSFHPDQFNNPVNPQIHYKITGPEIWRDTDGNVDAFIAGIGTGGTFSGIAKFLKEKNPNLHAVALEPSESPILAGKPAGPHKIQGIAPGFVANTMDMKLVDELYHVKSQDALDMQAKLAKKLGLLVGISAGAAIVAASEIAQRPEFDGKNVVAILPDTGERYLSMMDLDV